jgi:hypothetical protein
MDDKTLKDFALHARKIAGEIPQPAQSNAIAFRIPDAIDTDLLNIRAQLIAVATAIDRYRKQRPA